MDQDVFDEGICDDVIPEDWAKIERARRTDGYRQGLEAGQEAALQEGFNLGFSQGIVTKFSISFTKGIVNALITSCHSTDTELDDDSTKTSISDLEAIMSDLDALQRASSRKKGKGGKGAGSGKTGRSQESKGARSSAASSSSSRQRKEDGHARERRTETSCVDSASSSGHTSGATGALRGSNDGHKGHCKVTGEETNAENAALSADECQKREGRPWLSENHPLQKIVEKLQPHLKRFHCEDIFANVSHPFLQL